MSPMVALCKGCRVNTVLLGSMLMCRDCAAVQLEAEIKLWKENRAMEGAR